VLEFFCILILVVCLHLQNVVKKEKKIFNIRIYIK
jgi:hypothetical protein